MQGTIRALLADDHTMFRQGLATLLASYEGVEVVVETANDEGAVTLAQKNKPDVVIMEVQMPFERAKENLKRMREVSPPPKVIIVTMFENPRYVRELMSVGASAYLMKSSSVEHLLAAIRTAVFDPEAENVVGIPRSMLEKPESGATGTISARELEILLLAAKGLSNRQIAKKINVADATVKRHLANAYNKMEVGSRGEAVRKALSEEWITIQEVTQENEQSQTQ